MKYFKLDKDKREIIIDKYKKYNVNVDILNLIIDLKCENDRLNMTRFEEMDARGMLEELGYEIKEKTSKYLRYLKKDSEYGSGAYIEFDLVNKKIRLYTKTPNYNNNPRYADFNEFQAINKQIEELGWK